MTVKSPQTITRPANSGGPMRRFGGRLSVRLRTLPSRAHERRIVSRRAARSRLSTDQRDWPLRTDLGAPSDEVRILACQRSRNRTQIAHQLA